MGAVLSSRSCLCLFEDLDLCRKGTENLILIFLKEDFIYV